MAPGARGELLAANLEPMLGVEEGFLQSGLDAITAEYGSMDSYLKSGLGLSAATIAKPKDKLIA